MLIDPRSRAADVVAHDASTPQEATPHGMGDDAADLPDVAALSLEDNGVAPSADGNGAGDGKKKKRQKKKKPSKKQRDRLRRQLEQGLLQAAAASACDAEARKEQCHAVVADLGNACWTYKHFTDEITTREYRAPEVRTDPLHYNEEFMHIFVCVCVRACVCVCVI